MIDAIGGRREALEKLSELCGNKGTLPLFEEEESPLDRFMQILGSKFSGHTEILNPAGLFVNNKQASPVMIILPNAIGLK
jgi:protease-4